MRTRAAVLFTQPGKWEVTELELEPPQQGELLIRMAAAGLCHSDDHILTGDLPVPPGALPIAGGHEGAGIIEDVGPNTSGWKVGDKVVLTFLPACGVCRWCASGMQNLCDNGARILSGVRDACLTSCGVATGWGSAVRSADVSPGDVVIVLGIGGIGMNAVQGAAHAGASIVIAVDPIEMKRSAAFSFGATHAVETMDEATEIARSFTNGQGADSCIVCVGVTTGEHIAKAVDAIRKAGTCVMTGLPRAADDVALPISARHLVLYQKRLQGSLFGASSPTKEIPALLELYRRGQLKLDELITTRYNLESINEGYADMRAGRNVRGIVDYGV